MSIELKDTLNLPQTEFPMRGDLVRREPERIAHWQSLGLYPAILKKISRTRPLFYTMAHPSQMATFT